MVKPSALVEVSDGEIAIVRGRRFGIWRFWPVEETGSADVALHRPELSRTESGADADSEGGGSRGSTRPGIAKGSSGVPGG